MNFLQETERVLGVYFALIWYQYKMSHHNGESKQLTNSQLNKLCSALKCYGSHSKTFIKYDLWF